MAICGKQPRLDVHMPTRHMLGGCGNKIASSREIYRCADCDAVFHRDCIRKHFELDINISAIKASPSPTFAVQLLNNTYRYGSAIVTGAEILANFPVHHHWKPETKA